jgi:hypothetical protein
VAANLRNQVAQVQRPRNIGKTAFFGTRCARSGEASDFSEQPKLQFGGVARGASMGFVIDYGDAIHLDAEALAEAGIAEAYERLMPRLLEFVKRPLEIVEEREDDAPSYSVKCEGKSFAIDSPEIEETSNSWGNATVALFIIVNAQLLNSTHRFYAINGGNDLFGIFLTPTQAAEARKALPNERDWPYLPKDEQEWYGQFH